jgi:hypothetical protein
MMTMEVEEITHATTPSIPFLVQFASKLFPITLLDPSLSFNAVINFISVAAFSTAIILFHFYFSTFLRSEF